MNSKISIIIADDHPILLKGLHDELLQANYNVVESVDNGSKALEAIVIHKPMIAILDIEMPLLSGFEVIQKARELTKATKFIILSSHKEKGFVLKATKLSISGYVLKDAPFSELQQCIKEVANGNTYFSQAVTSIIDNQISPELKKINFLSPSERTILRFVAQGKSSKEISDILIISKRTVEKHRSNIMTKLDIDSKTTDLTQWASDHKEIIFSVS